MGAERSDTKDTTDPPFFLFPFKPYYGLVVNLILIVLVILIAFLIRSVHKQLVITDSNTGTIYGRWQLDSTVEHNEFSIEFIHSVNQTPVKETFAINGTTIQALSTRFSSFGAGMQTEIEPGQSLVRDGDAMIITGLTRTFPELRYIVGTVSDHILYINDQTISLRDLCGRNAHITFRVKK
jgi:hypothetical protein